jgi:ASCH domain.
MNIYKALSVVAPAGDNIHAGRKTLEIRDWVPEELPLRNLVIIQNRTRLSSNGITEDPDGEAVAIVDIETITDWQEEELEAACASHWEQGWKAWQLSNVRPLHLAERFPARLRIYNVELPDL